MRRRKKTDEEKMDLKESKQVGEFIESENSDEVIESEPELEIQELPSRLLVLKNFALASRMPGQSAAVSTRYFREGQIIYEPEKIKWLLDNNAPVDILN